MGGIAWFGIPMGIATSMGLAAVALKNQGLITLTPDEVSAGLPAVKGMFLSENEADKQPLPHLWDLLVDWQCFSYSS
jgi:2-methylcitrate dehydratase PrpD